MQIIIDSAMDVVVPVKTAAPKPARDSDDARR